MFQITLNVQGAPVYQCLVFDMVVKSSYIYKVSGSFSFEMCVMELKSQALAQKHSTETLVWLKCLGIEPKAH